MATSSFTLTQLEALESALAQGATRVKYSDKEVEYRSLAEMMKIRDLMRRELGLSSGQTGRIYLESDKDLS